METGFHLNWAELLPGIVILALSVMSIKPVQRLYTAEPRPAILSYWLVDELVPVCVFLGLLAGIVMIAASVL